ncbi:MAG: peptide deformylase [Promethearchaeota archaeon]
MNIIKTVPDPILNEVSKDVNLLFIGKTNKDLVEPMKAVLEQTSGVGLSAVQVGELKRVFIMRTKDKEVITVYNPKILEKRNYFVFAGEACLSIPGQVASTERYNEIVAEWYDEKKQYKKATLTGMEAIIFQHEYDHLDGILFTERKYSKQNKVGRNEPCPCGSGKKYKKCCGR